MARKMREDLNNFLLEDFSVSLKKTAKKGHQVISTTQDQIIKSVLWISQIKSAGINFCISIAI